MFATERKATVKIKFTGDEKDKAGFAQSQITVTPDKAHNGYYLVYYTDGKNVLPDYDEAVAIRANGSNPVKGSIGDGIMLPVNAKGIAVFECETYFTDKTPDISQAIATAQIPESKQLSSFGSLEFTFGALSDTHMNYEQHSRGAYAKLRYAMDFYAEKNMDIVLIAGDATGDRGESPDLEVQYEKHIEIINDSAFPIEKVYESIGNHGNTPQDSPLLDKYLGGNDEIHPYEGSAYFHVLYKGKNGARDNLFIFMAQEMNAPGDSAAYDNFSKEQIDWLEGLLNQYGNTETNIFIIEHTPFLRFGAGDIKNGTYTACITFNETYTQTMRLKALLETYKDAIVMSGHTHVSFYENANYSDEYNSFARTVHIGSNSQPCAYGESASMIRSYDSRHNVTPEYGSEGYTVEVYSDYIIYTGYNFSTGKIVPGACLIIPVKAYGGPGKTENVVPTPDEAFEGSGTLEDPYIIADEEDFMNLTNGFNASSSPVETEMYGYGKYFLQTSDIDMTLTDRYCGTIANGSDKCFFAGIYNGNGYTLKVSINDTVQRSVFPYVYGVICNLKIQGSITSEASAQPVRSLYGSLVNCIFDLSLTADNANGILYSNYNLVYNVFTKGSLAGKEINPVASNDTSTQYENVYHFYIIGASPANDDFGTRTDDVKTIAKAFHDTSSDAYQEALNALGGFKMLTVEAKDGELVFIHTEDETDSSAENSLDNNSDLKSDEYSGNWWIWVIVVSLIVIVSGIVVIVLKRIRP